MNEPYLKRNVRLESWSSDWAHKFEAEHERLKRLLGKNCLYVYHIGSTSIKGIRAKPIVDMLVVVSSLKVLDDVDFKGYEVKGENGIKGRQYIQKNERGERLYHIHIYEEGHPEIANHLFFRDALRNSSKLAQEYEELKILLADKHQNDKAAYTEAKTDFIQQVINNA